MIVSAIVAIALSGGHPDVLKRAPEPQPRIEQDAETTADGPGVECRTIRVGPRRTIRKEVCTASGQ